MFHGGLDLYSTSAVCEGLSHDLYDYTVTVCSVNPIQSNLYCNKKAMLSQGNRAMPL